MTQLACPPAPALGRRASSTIPAERNRHLTALSLRRRGWPIKLIMRFFEIERPTVYLWFDRAKGYPEAATPESLEAAVDSRTLVAALGLDPRRN